MNNPKEVIFQNQQPFMSIKSARVENILICRLLHKVTQLLKSGACNYTPKKHIYKLENVVFGCSSSF